MLNVIVLSVVMLIVIMLSVVTLNVIMLSIVTLNVIMLNIFMLSVVSALLIKHPICKNDPKNCGYSFENTHQANPPGLAI